MYRTDNFVEQHLRESFPNTMPLKDRLLQNIKSGSLFGYVQCDIEVPESLREAFANFPPIFKNIIVGRDDTGLFMKEYAQKGLLTQIRGMLISSYFLENGTIITPLLLFYLDSELVSKKTDHFAQYTRMKSFNNFVQSVVNAR